MYIGLHISNFITNYITRVIRTSSFARSPTYPLVCLYLSNPVPQIVSASAAAPRAIASIRFNCYLPLASSSAAALDCVHFNCSPIESASTAAPRLRPLQLLLPDCARFNCCSLIACVYVGVGGSSQQWWPKGRQEIITMLPIRQHSEHRHVSSVM